MRTTQKSTRANFTLWLLRLLVFTTAIFGSWIINQSEVVFWKPILLFLMTLCGGVFLGWSLGIVGSPKPRLSYASTVIDLVISIFGLIMFDPFSPVLAIPIFAVSYHSVLYNSKNPSQFLLVGAVIMIFLVFNNTSGAIQPIVVISFIIFATINAFICLSILKSPTRKISYIQSSTKESQPSRLLTDVKRMLNAQSKKDITSVIAESISSNNDNAEALVMLIRPIDGMLIPIAWKTTVGPPQNGDVMEVFDASSPAALCARERISFTYGPAGIHKDNLPKWAKERGFNSAVITPMISGPNLIGVTYMLRSDHHNPSKLEIENLEIIANFGAKIISNLVPSSTKPNKELKRESIFRRMDNSYKKERTPIELPNLELHPDLDQVTVFGEGISLSRTEFNLIYEMATSPNTVVDQKRLIKAGWDDEHPADNLIDSTVYRLRKKIEGTPGGGGLVKTVKGKGYMLISSANLF